MTQEQQHEDSCKGYNMYRTDSQATSMVVAAHVSSKTLAEMQVEDEIRDSWERKQLELKEMFIGNDAPVIKRMLQATSGATFYIGGVDISFIKGNDEDACAALVVLSFPELKVVYRRLEMIKLTAPYIPGFLAFREAEFLVKLYKTLLQTAPQYKTDVIFVDGNGQLHPREFGLACHLGVLLDVPCIGVAKNLIHVDGIDDKAEHQIKKQKYLQKAGDRFALTNAFGKTLGMAVRSTDSAPNPIYMSVGHRISLSSSVSLVLQCCKYRIPEPTRYADQFSRQYLADGKREPEEIID